MKEVREAWFEDQLDLDPDRLVFVDETGVNTKMARLRVLAHFAWMAVDRLGPMMV